MNTTKQLKGFAVIDPDLQREIASKGGKSAHAQGKAHRFTSEEAAAAARIGHARGTCHQFTPEEGRAAGRKGGKAKAAKFRHAAQDLV